MTKDILRIAIVSDLHIGDNARDFDMQPNGKPPYADSPGYLSYLKKAVEKNGTTADLLVVSGDITDKAQPSQFEHAAKVIKEIAATLGVPDGQTIVVPGNHDLNWDIAKLASDKQEPFWLSYKFAPFSFGSKQAGCDETHANSLVTAPHFFLHEHNLADVWCFNSAAYDIPDQKPHRGEIREAHRMELEANLAARYAGGTKDRYRIFVTHHHPKAQPDLYKDIPDFSGMVNGDSLLETLIDYRFDLVLHGHKHRPWCRPFLEDGKDPIVIWCSGSFAQSLGNAYYGSIGNLWHLLEIQGTNESDHCFGIVRSYAFAPSQGWGPSRPVHHGIDSITPFGYLADRPTVTALAKSHIMEAMKASSYVSWEAISAKDKLLQFQTGVIVWKVLDELCHELDLRAHGEQDSLDDLIIVKKEASR